MFLVAIVVGLSSTSHLLSSFGMTPVEHLFFTLAISGLLISSKAVGKLLVEPKTLGWGNTLGKDFKSVFKNLGVLSTPLKCFLKDFWDKWKMGYEGKEVGGFLKKINW
jgi:hypothetical protein